MIDRRALLEGLSCVPLLAAVSGGALAQGASPVPGPGPLPEKVFGRPDAPVAVVEYASLTCHHCMNFHMNTWPAFKAKYVDTGKVRFVIREFPLDSLAMAGFMLARCAGEEKWYPVVDLLYRTQEGWAHSAQPLDGLVQTLRQAGMSRESVEACLKRDDVFQGIKTVSDMGDKAGVSSTPTFFVNGQKHVGALSLEQLDGILEPLLAGR